LGVKAKGKGWLFYETAKKNVILAKKWSNFLLYFVLLSLITSLLELLVAALI